jgi:glycosyltransferase involved in cell wall biosynthesis
MQMNVRPYVSVCVPTYNYGRFMRDCIESVLAQTLSDWELVICDDCSTDNTTEIVQEYAQHDKRIRYLKNEQRLGMNGNIKLVAEQGRGEYLKMLCSDDWLAPECLEVLTRSMKEHPQAVLATSAETLTNERGEALRVQFLFGQPVSIIAGEEMLDRMARGEGFGGNSSFLIRASAYREVSGYDVRCLYAGDYDLAARLCRKGDYLHIDKPLFYGRIQPNSSSSQDPKKLLDVIDWFEIPSRIFQPQRFGNREWRRHQKLIAHLTARYLVNMVLQLLRGHYGYASSLWRILIKRGNFFLGIPMLILHLPLRLYRRLNRQKITDQINQSNLTPSARPQIKPQAHT